MNRRRALITGASSGIGAATARLLATSGWQVLAVARRAEKLDQLRETPGIEAMVCDITSDDQVQKMASWVAEHGPLDTLINNAGAAIGVDTVWDAPLEDWRDMLELNVLGTKRVISAVLPLLRDAAAERGSADLLTITSTAGMVSYEGGGGYNAAKFAERGMVGALRLELAGEPIRVIEIAPGMVKTDEFTLKRTRGNEAWTEALYRDVDRPLTAEDVALTVKASLDLPSHVNLDLVVVRPVAQAAQHKLHRGPLVAKREKN